VYTVLDVCCSWPHWPWASVDCAVICVLNARP